MNHVRKFISLLEDREDELSRQKWISYLKKHSMTKADLGEMTKIWNKYPNTILVPYGEHLLIVPEEFFDKVLTLGYLP